MTQEMDEFWKPIADPNPDVLARQLAVLKDWLSRPAWTPNQAACLLAGVCPIDDLISGQVFAAYLPVGKVEAYLPGRREWDHSPEIGKKITEGRIAQIETSLIQAFSPDRVTPRDFITLGMKFGFEPPWLDYALRDSDCVEFLPRDLTDESPERTSKNVTQQKKARQRWDNDDKRILLNGPGREEFNRLRQGKFRGHTRSSGEVVFASLERAIREAIKKAAPDEADCWPEPKTIIRQVKIWLSEDQSDNAGALSENAGAKAT